MWRRELSELAEDRLAGSRGARFPEAISLAAASWPLPVVRCQRSAATGCNESAQSSERQSLEACRRACCPDEVNPMMRAAAAQARDHT